MGGMLQVGLDASADRDDLLSFLAQSADSTLVFDHRDRILFANPPAEALFDRSLSSLRGRAIGTLLPVGAIRGNAAASPAAREITIARRDGSARPCFLSLVPLVRTSGSVYVATLREVVPDAEEVSRLRMLSLATDRTGTSVVLADARGRILFANAAFERLTGYSAEWAIGRTPGSFLQGDLSDRDTIGRIGEGLRAGRPVDEVIVNYTRAGVPYLIELLIVPVRDAAGQVVNFVSVQANVTAARDAQRHQRAMLQAIGEATAIAQWSGDGTPLECSAFLASLCPNTPPLSRILDADRCDAVVAGKVLRCEVQWPRSGGETICLEAVFSCTRDISGQVDRLIMCGTDATARNSGVKAGSDAMQGMMKGIGALTKAIRRVASLTNILSVNAAIEAGRAGDAGAGFGVIGREIRSLSAEVHDTLEQIDALIREGHDTVGRLQGTIGREEGGSRRRGRGATGPRVRPSPEGQAGDGEGVRFGGPEH